MNVVCADGTVFECRGYEVDATGVSLYGEPADEEDRYDERRQIGYVPHDMLRYILPDDAVPADAAVQPRAAGQGAPPAGQPSPDPRGQPGPAEF